MKNIKILHLYSDALDLYGDYKNLDVLVSRIKEGGHNVSVDKPELYDDISFDQYDMVYIGHGKARNLAAVAEHFVKYEKEVKASVESGTLWLCTGNSRELFGKSFTTPDGDAKRGIGLFDYKGVETNKVFVCDMKGVPSFASDSFCYGFANRTAYLEGENEYPLFTNVVGFSDSESCDGTEGTLYKNFFGTFSMGPVLARNPNFLKEILKRLLGDVPKECDFSLEEKAQSLVLAEFK